MQPPPRIHPSVQLRSFSTAVAIFAALFFAGSGARADPSAAALAELASEICVLSGGTRANVEAIATAKGWRKSDRPANNAQDPLEASWEVVTLPGTLTVRVGQSILNDDMADVCTVEVETGKIPFAALQPELTRRLPLKRETPPGPDGSAKAWNKIVEFYSLQPSAPGDIATQLARPAHLLVHFNPSGVVHSIQISAAARAPAIAADVAPLAEAIHELCVKTGGTASAMRFAADVKGWQLILDRHVTRWRKSAQTPSGGHVFTVERSNSASPNCSVRSLTPRYTHAELVSALQKLVNLEQEQDEENGLRRWQLFGIAPSVPPMTLPAGTSRYTLGVRSNHYGVVLNVRFWAR